MPFQNLYNSIFDTNDTGESQVEMLERQVKRYPYFTLAHFFLLKNTGPGHPAYAGIAAKTAIHFNHPFYMHQQLHKVADPQVTTDNEFATVFHTPDTFPEQILDGQDADTDDEVYPEELVGVEHDTTAAEPPAEDAETIVSGVDDHSATKIDPVADAEPVVAPAPVEPEEPLQVNDEHDEQGDPDDTDGNELPQSSQPEPVNHVEVEPAETNTAAAAPPAPEAPLFEPLFATDYFASQGIKLRDDVQPNDKLGKQLRSFTDWLKTMKKVHEGKLPAGNETLDLSVQKLAEKSNKEEDVITETMAEVYLQQGKQQKAKEIYEKLVLLNPSKMAYFAAKIEQIK